MTAGPRATTPCPCGTGAAYGACCGPLHQGVGAAATAEALMRSRYSAYAIGAHDYLLRTWHPRTRPDDLPPTPGVEWIALEILATEAGGEEDHEGEVTFRARFRVGEREEALEERSRFTRRGARWVYLDGVQRA